MEVKPIKEKEIEKVKRKIGKRKKATKNKIRSEIIRYLVVGNVIEAVKTAQNKLPETFRDIIPEKYLRRYVMVVISKVYNGGYEHDCKFGCGSLFDLAIIAKSISRKINFTESVVDDIESIIDTLWGGVYNYDTSDNCELAE